MQIWWKNGVGENTHTHKKKKKKEREKEKQCSKKVDRYRHYLEKHVKSRDVSGKSEDTLLLFDLTSLRRNSACFNSTERKKESCVKTTPITFFFFSWQKNKRKQKKKKSV